MDRIEEIMRVSPVIPVLVVEDVKQARPIAEALVEGGLNVIEVTLRTAAALDVISEMKKVRGAIVGAGTVLDEGDLREAIDAGAEFIVSPGLTKSVAKAAAACGAPFLPGVATASDIMRGLDLGLEHFKFFPAATSGGVAALKALTAPFAECRFCPTGGVDINTAPEWLAVDGVLCVGGSWMVRKGATDSAAIRSAASRCASLRSQPNASA